MAKEREVREIPPPTLQALEEYYGPPILDSNGQAICGVERIGDSKRACMREAGWGTVHSGYGPCKDHGGEKNTGLSPRTRVGSYGVVIAHQRLRDLYFDEERRENPDDLDREVLLIRAILMLLAEQFGMEISEDDPDTFKVTSISAHANEVGKMVDRLSETIKRKYEVMKIAGEVIPRETVRAYVEQVITILNQTLRNTCPECNHNHNLRDRCLAALDILGSL